MKEYPFGGFWRRVAAAVIDQMILGVIYGFLLILGTVAGISGFNLHNYTLEPEAVMKTTGGIMLLYHAYCALINMAYFVFFHGLAGQTPGKMAMGLKVVQASGAEMTFGIAFLRWVGYIVSGGFFFLGYIWVAFDRRKQGWHDKIARTVVIRKERFLAVESEAPVDRREAMESLPEDAPGEEPAGKEKLDKDPYI